MMTFLPTLKLTGQAQFAAHDSAAQPVQLYANELQRMQASTARRDEFLWGRKAAAEALYNAGCANADTHYIGRDEFGAPQWPAGWIGSITHSKGTYAAVAARACDYLALGVDIETLRGTDMDRAIGRICLVDADDKSTLPTLVFSAKEAIYKACHPLIGGNLWFTDFTVSQVAANGTFAWHFNLNPAVHGHGHYKVTDSSVLTCVALHHGHALGAYATNPSLKTQLDLISC